MSLIKEKWFVSLFFILIPNVLFALPNDREQTMYIAADSSLFNYKTGVDTYEGNVKVDQGTTHLTANRLVTEKNDQHKIVSAIAYGTDELAEFTTLPAKDDPLLHAKAVIIKFYPLTSMVVLENRVIVTQAENSFHGPLIIYNMKDQIVSAPASKTGRTTIVIEPDKRRKS